MIRVHMGQQHRIDRLGVDTGRCEIALNEAGAGLEIIGSLIKTDSLYNLCYPVQSAPAAVCQNGVMDYVLHPIEPLAVRLTIAGQF